MVSICGRQIGPDYSCFIIAEAGVNHNGNLGLAKKLIDSAFNAGADAVKFQSFKAEGVVNSTAPKAKYQLETTNTSESQMDMLRNLELSPEAHQELLGYCKNLGIIFLSTPFDNVSADMLAGLDVPAFKIGSGELTSLPFLDYVARKNRPMLVSTGMSYLGEVDDAVRTVRDAGCDQLVLLHCVSNYPAEPADANLLVIGAMRTAFNLPVGYSDHTMGIQIPLAAAALGACVIEKHLTLDRNMSGPDHRASLEPDEFRVMVQGIRTVETALGTGVKEPALSETNSRQVVRRSLAAARNIPTGTILKADILTQLRPASGISPALLEQVVGRKTRRVLTPGELLDWSDLE